jgi:hypothetical protein
VLAANEVPTVIQRDDGFTGDLHAILVHNRGRSDGSRTASSSRPRTIRGGWRLQVQSAQRAGRPMCRWIEARANALHRRQWG